MADLRKQLTDAMAEADGRMKPEDFSRAFEEIIKHLLRFEIKLLGKQATSKAELQQLVQTYLLQAQSTLQGKDGRDGVDGKDGKHGKDGVDGSPDTAVEIIGKVNSDKSEKKIKKEKVEGLASLLDHFNTRTPGKLTLRNGGMIGEIVAGSGVTVDNSDPSRPVVSAAGSSLSIKTATGTIDDSNTSFTFSAEPSLVVVNGAMYRHNSGVTIAGTAVTTDFPVGTGGAIFGL